jgi:predicted DNA-binding transcriptional regulator AlpA
MKKHQAVVLNAPIGTRYINPKALCTKFSRGKSWIYDLMKKDPTFPRPLRVGNWPLWVEHEVDAWMARQPRGEAQR